MSNCGRAWKDQRRRMIMRYEVNRMRKSRDLVEKKKPYAMTLGHLNTMRLNCHGIYQGHEFIKRQMSLAIHGANIIICHWLVDLTKTEKERASD
ncbi:hypothetical protein AQUCO_06000024v1 [Aquilegia coerulea]|uniref:Uncharacterized protein n=1 Tax=Aquilegia coerulea TaxID=218851 RepID=A0A2G5CDP0_AQUCA|nr:hypothetical protein AQUCO_06000024v1 [Aquilegia coerulea]